LGSSTADRDRPADGKEGAGPAPPPTTASKTQAPAINLPKGGGAIRGLGEKFAANPVSGSASMAVPIAISPGRSGFGPSLSLSYDSGAGNGPFGFGWRLALPSITRKTDKRLPQYFDPIDSGVFLLSGAEDLEPVLVEDTSGNWVPEKLPPRTVNNQAYYIRRYRPRIEGLFARIERWTNADDPADTFWRSISRDNVTSWYGRTPDSRIADPEDPSRIFSWLICQSHDDKGDVAAYGYKAENSERIFEVPGGAKTARSNEVNRSSKMRSAQRYLKFIRYGNRTPYFPQLAANAAWPEPPKAKLGDDGSDDWMFEVVLDYGDHDTDAPVPNEALAWPARPDPFSTYRAGFEVRTYRTCQRFLMFHHFPGDPAVGRNSLVRSTDFAYSDEDNPANVRNPVYCFLMAVTQNGCRRNGASYVRRGLPPLEFIYSEPIVQDLVEEVDPASLEHLPVGLDERFYRWTDLHGEGVPGILVEQESAWHYKRNLSPLTNEACFAPLEHVAMKPGAGFGAGAEIMDLAGDGQPDLVMMDGPAPGLYEHDEAEGWRGFRPFTARLNRDFRDANSRFIDLDGDGRADLLITETDALVWHPSLGEAGFGPERRAALKLDEEKGPRIVFADATQSIYLADLSGDGLTDIVRIGNGEVCYWPNLGHGRFGAKVAMENAPWFDHPRLFDQKRIRLADIDGSGTTDIIYLHAEGVRLYFNQSGNGWGRPHHLKVFPSIDDLERIVPVDLLGNGTACLAWSSALPGNAGRQMRYVNLMGGLKPHLLVQTVNNLGAETRIGYAPSTKFYLQDKRNGNGWITRLPFPVHVVERVEIFDQVSRNRFVTSYAYHHGYFDGEERDFQGFGMVEQWDSEEYAALAAGVASAANVEAASHVPSVHTKSWFHTGFYLDRQHVSRHFEREYFREPGLTLETARPLLLDDTLLPADLTLEEEREACRSLKGMMLRREVYALDGVGKSADHPSGMPYSVAEESFAIRCLQPRAGNRHAIFFARPREALTYQYERNPKDPRIQHALTLEVDAFGNVLKQATIGYGRRVSPLAEPWDRDRQTKTLITFAETRVTKDYDTGAAAIDRIDQFQIPLPFEALTFELTGYVPTGEAGRFQASDFIEPDPLLPGRWRHKFTDEVAYEAAPTPNPCRRPIKWLRTLYRRDDLTGLLSLGGLQPLALPGESYRLALTPGLIDQVFKRPREGLADEALVQAASRPAILGGEGGYVDLDGNGHWWVPSGRSFFSSNPVDPPAVELAEAKAHFFVERRFRDPFGEHAFVDYDVDDLLIGETRDALGNRVTAEANDYRVLQPRLVSDPNRNRTEYAFDTLGLWVGTAVMGKPLPAAAEGDSLGGFKADLTQLEQDSIFEASNPQPGAAVLLKDATTRIVYDVERFRRTRQANPNDPDKWQPACAATLARETHLHSPLPPQGLKLKLGFSFSDGFNREIQGKVQAAPGPVPKRDAAGKIILGPDGQPILTAADANPRWIGSGWSVFNNKGKPVRQYEPFFSDTHAYEFDVRVGVSPVLFYDPAERIVATLHPEHSFGKVLFDPWQETSWDVNDCSAPHGVQTGDPRTDKDVAGFVARYFGAMGAVQAAAWQTWHQQRIGGALGNDEKIAAERAEAHADTPSTVHLDALGRPFLTIDRNRVMCAGHPLDGKPDEEIRTRIELDIEGNRLRLFDERKLPDGSGLPLGTEQQRTVMDYSHDMLGNRIRQLSMEAGTRWTLSDVSGQQIRAWDSRGHNFTTSYDALRRPTGHYVRGTFSNADPLKPNSDPRTLGQEIQVDRIDYGEGVPNPEVLNLRTRAYRHLDSAGIATSARLDAAGNPLEAYDFKGNGLRSTRQLVSDYDGIPDWKLNPPLEGERFESSTRYDALNRPCQSVAPHSSLTRPGHPNKFNVIQPVFDEGGQLKQVDVWLERSAAPAGLIDPASEAPSPVGIARIEYDAKGQRLRIDYKGGFSTAYRYDLVTSRLIQLATSRDAVDFPGDDPQPAIAGWPGTQVQNLHYVYDPAANITHIRDDAQQAIHFKNQRVEPSNDYVYDALYRLVQADGREHLGQIGGTPIPHSNDEAGRVGLLSADGAGQFAPTDGKAVGSYTERYVYDAVGNMLQMRHRGSQPVQPGWTSGFSFDEASLIEPAKDSNRLSRTILSNAGGAPQLEPYLYDAHGNMLRMPHLGGQSGPNMEWDYRDQLRRVDKGGGGEVFYVYDSSGQRVRKVWKKSPALTEERIYLGGFEIFRRHGGTISPATAKLERETLHVMDDDKRIALVETRTLDVAGSDPAPPRLIRYQLANHLSSSCVELDDEARIISFEEYSPYGSSTYQGVRSQTEAAKRYRFTGKERDEESGFYYHGARYYAPWLGRWTACDPSGLADGPNLYRYARANPIAFRDPSGHDSQEADAKQRQADDDRLKSIGVTRQQVIDFASMNRGDFIAKYGGDSVWSQAKFYWNFPRDKVRELPPSMIARVLPAPDTTLYMQSSGKVATNADETSSRARNFNPGTPLGGVVGTTSYGVAKAVGASDKTAMTALQIGGATGDVLNAGLAAKGSATKGVGTSVADSRPKQWGAPVDNVSISVPKPAAPPPLPPAGGAGSPLSRGPALAGDPAAAKSSATLVKGQRRSQITVGDAHGYGTKTDADVVAKLAKDLEGGGKKVVIGTGGHGEFGTGKNFTNDPALVEDQFLLEDLDLGWDSNFTILDLTSPTDYATFKAHEDAAKQGGSGTSTIRAWCFSGTCPLP